MNLSVHNLQLIKKSAKWLILFLLPFVFINKAYSQNTYYWVGGTGVWNDLNHWATTSGGTIKHTIVPSILDNVVFDANSFTASGQSVTLNQEAFSKDFSWNSVSNNPTFTGAGYNLNIAGNFTVQGTPFTFSHANGNLLITGDLLVDGVNMSFTKSGGTMTVGGALTIQNSAPTFSRTGGNTQVSGNMTLQGLTGGTFTTNNTVTVGGNMTFQNISSGSYSMGNGLNVTGNLTFQNMTPSAFTVSGLVIAVTGDFLMDNAPFNFNLNNVAMTVNGNFSIINGASTFTHSNVLTVKKSFTLSSAVTFNQTSRVDFTAVTTGQTITSAGKSFTNVRFNGSGGEWILQDNFKATGTTEHFTGIFRSNGKSVDYGQNFNGVDNGSVRTLDYAGTDTVRAQYQFRVSANVNTILTMGGAVLLLHTVNWSEMYIDGGGKTFGTVVIRHLYNTNSATNIRFRNSNSVYGNVFITINNGSRIYKEDTNNTFGNITINYINASVNSTDWNYILGTNTFGDFTITSNGLNPMFYCDQNNTFGQVSLPAGTNWQIANARVQNLTGLSATGTCLKFVNIYSSGSGSTITDSNGGSNAIDFVKLTNMVFTGATWSATNSLDYGGNSGITMTPLTGQTYYWVGGAGNWSNTARWSLTSGGAPAGCIPVDVDHVVFDNNSFTGTDQTVTLDIAPTITNMTWTAGVTGGPNFNGSQALILTGDLNVAGTMDWNLTGTLTLRKSIILNNTMTWNHNNIVYFSGTTAGNTINMSGKTFINRAVFDNPGNTASGQWTLAAAFKVLPSTYTTINDATFSSGGYSVDFGDYLEANGNAIKVMDFTGTDTVRVKRGWYILNNTNATLTMGNAVVLLRQPAGEGNHIVFEGGGKAYYDVVFDAKQTNGTYTIYVRHNSTTFRDVYFNISGNQNVRMEQTSYVFRDVYAGYLSSNTGYSPNFEVFNNHTFTSLQFTNPSVVPKLYLHASNIIDTLKLYHGMSVFFGNNQIQTLQSVTATSLCTRLINIASTSAGNQATLTDASGTNSLDYVSLKDIKAQGGASWNASNVVDNGNNTGWTITVAPSVTYYWIGGTGNWNDGAHWSVSSGGAPAGCSPNPQDDVVFDNNSFSATGQTVTLLANAICRNMTWTTGVTQNPTFTGSFVMEVNGDLQVLGTMTWVQNNILYPRGDFILNGNVTWNHAHYLYFYSDSTNNIVNTAGKTLLHAVAFDAKTTGSAPKWTLGSNYKLQNGSNQYITYVVEGTLETAGYTVDAGYEFRANDGNDVRTINLTGTDTLRMQNAWRIHSGVNTTFIKDNATILLLTSSGDNQQFEGGNRTYNDVVVRNTSNTHNSYIQFLGNNNIRDVFIRFPFTGNAGKQVFFDNVAVFRNIDIIYSATNNLLVHFRNGPNTFNNVNVNMSSSGSSYFYFQNTGHQFNNFNVQSVSGNANFYFQSANNLFQDVVVTSTNLGSAYLQMEQNASFNKLDLPNGFDMLIYAGRTQTIGNFIPRSTCLKRSKIRGQNATTSKISQASGVINTEWITLENHTVQGGATFNATDVTQVGTITGWNAVAVQPITLFWVGGTGNWNDANHWAFVSGGPGNGCLIPTSIDHAVFDANSFTAVSQIVTMNITGQCKNMIWNNVVFTPTFYQNGNTQDLTVYGDLVVNSTMVWNWTNSGNSILYLKGSVTIASTVTWNHFKETRFEPLAGTYTINMGGKTFLNNIRFSGAISAKWYLLNGLTVFNSVTTYFVQGELYSNGYAVDFGFALDFNNTNIKKMDFTGTSTVKVRRDWLGNGTGTTLVSGDAIILLESSFSENLTFNGGSISTYGDVTIRHLHANNLTVTLNGNNVIQDLVFEYTNRKDITINGNSTFGNFTLTQDYSVTSNIPQHSITGINTFGSFVILSLGVQGPEFSISQNNTYGNLVSAGRGTRLKFGNGKTQTINGEILVLGTGGQPIFFNSTTAGAQATISKASGNVCLDFVWIKDINATGGATFNAGINGANLGNNTGINFNSACAAYYWIGGSGNWSDLNHWATSSGGSTLHVQLPTEIDDVYFDANSFTASGQTVTFDDPNAECRSMNWFSALYQPTLAGSTTGIDIYGSLVLTPFMNQNWNGTWNFMAQNGQSSIDTKGKTLQNLTVNTLMGSVPVLLTNNLKIANDLTLTRGNFQTMGYGIDTKNFNLVGTESRTLQLGASVVTVSDGKWDVQDATNLTINPGTSKIIVKSNGGSAHFYGGSKTYNNANIYTTTTMSSTMTGSNTFSELKVEPGVTLSLEAGSTQTTTSLLTSGTCSKTLTIQSTVPGTQANFSQASGVVSTSFLNLKDNNATGGATFNATQATDNGNNSGWNFINVPALQVSVAITNATCPTPNNGVANAVVIGGSAPFSYLWNTIETTQTLNNLSAGTYAVTVTDGAGCVAMASGTVSQPASYNFAATTTGSMVCYGLTNGTASVTLGGTAQLPATYLWSNSATAATITNLAPATYSVTVTDAVNCKAIRSAVVDERPNINTNLFVNSGKCLNAPISFTGSGTGTGLQYAWDFGDTGTANIQSPSHTYTAPNSYTTQLTITDENNCSSSALQVLTITTPPALAAVTATNASCLNTCDGAVTLTPSDGLLPFSEGNFEFIHNFDGTVFNSSVFSRDNIATYSQNNALNVSHATPSWDKYVYTNQTFARATGKDFTFSYYHPASTNSMIGWHGNSTTGNNTSRYIDMLYAFYFNGNSTLNIYEDGNNRGTFTAQVPGGYTTDTWYEGKIVLRNTGADYYLRKQGDATYALVYSSTFSTETNLRAGFTYYSSGTAITDNWKVGYSNPATANVCPGTYQYFVTDANFCTASASTTVSVGDATPPTVNCPINQTVNLSAGNCSAAVTVAAPTFSDNCTMLGNVLDFDGTNDYITIPGSFNSNFSSNRITIEGWVYNASGYTPNNCMLAGESFLGDGNIRFAVHLIGGNIYAGTHPANLAGVFAPFATNTWVHFAGTYDGSLIRLYLNGTQVASAAVAGLPNGNEEWRIGRRWDNADYFKGKLDEVRIWNVARTATEINANKNQTISPQTGLVAYYRFNQGVAGGNNTAITQATDASGNNNNGTLQNFTLNSATSNFLLDNPNVSFSIPTNSFNSTTNASGTYPLGTNTVTWSLTDQNNNIGTCSHTITVLEPTPPSLTCPANQTLSLDGSNQATLPDYSGLATVSDNCPGAVQLVQSPTAGNTITGTTPVTVTFIATDVSGNTATCSFTVTGVIIDMLVEGNSQPIMDGDTSPSSDDHTQFGNVNVGGNLVRTFTIQNTGTAPLNISSVNSNNPLFTVGALTPASPIPAPGSATFTVTFSPTATGTQNADIGINWDEGVYDFSVQGTGVCGNTCLNGATQNNDCSCNCLPGYSGANCQIVSYIFYGYTNTDWSTASNWNTGVVPTTALLNSGDAVIVAANCIMPALSISFPSGTTFTINPAVSLTADLNAYITINSGVVFTINGNLYQGRVTNTGTMDVYGIYSAFYMTNMSGGNMNVKTGASYSCPACAESMQAGSFVNNEGTLHVGTSGTWNCTLTNYATGSVTDGGLGAQITIGSSGTVHNYGYYLSRTSGVAGVFNNYSTGILTMPSSCNFTIYNGGQFFNSGNITIPVGDPFSVNAGGTLTNNSTGIITNNGSMPVALTATMTNNGTYKGNGTFSTSLFTNQTTGFVVPGSSPGCLTYGSGFTNSGTLNIEAAGTTPCTGHDKLFVTGTATLGNTLALTITFTPVVLTILTIIDADVLSGTFTTVTGLTTNWSVNYNTVAGNVELVYTPPVPATALHLNGAAPSDNVNSPSITAFGTQPVTIEFWAKNESSFCFPVGFANSYLFMFAGGNFVIRKDFVGDYNTGATVSNTGTVWEHFALTYDGINTFRAYKNGVPTPTPSFTGFSGSAATGTLQVGEPKGGYPYTGAIDEVRMWSELRSDAQILANYNTELTDMTPCLQVYWKFNQGYIGANNSAVTSAYDNAYAVNQGGTLTNFALTGSTGNWVAGSGITDVVSEYILAPEADLKGNGNGIADGDPSPTPTDHTDFGNVPLSLSRTFTVENNGTATLNISGLTITGTNAADFTVTTPPAATVSIGNNTTFTVLFTPSSVGLKTAVMHINNDDCDEGDYNVTIQGTGTCVAPTITCPGNLSANTSSNCDAVVTYSPTTTGNPAPSVTYVFSGASSGSGSGNGSGSAFNKGTTTVTLTATNACGSQTCSFNVVVTDTTLPTITCTGNVSINNTPGQCTGSTTLTQPTVSDNCIDLGNALNFDGVDDRVNLQTPLFSTSNAGQNYTIELWMKASPSANVGGLITQYPNTASPIRWGIRLNGSNRISYWRGGVYLLTSTIDVADNTWHHIAFVKNGSGSNQLLLYVDGVLNGTGTDSDFFENTNTVLGFFPNAGSPYNGSLDGVRVWNVARTQSQIVANMNLELNAQSGLIAAYNFNQGTANGNNAGITNAIDDSGNGVTGTLQNFALNGTSSNWVNGKTVVPTITNNAPGTYPIGTTTVTWTATDVVGNTATCAQTVTVTDNEPPALTCPANQTINALSGICTANYTIADPVSDNCSGPIWSYTLSGVTLGSVSGIADGTGSGSLTFNKGVTLVSLSATDAVSNASTCSFTVTVNDTQVPTITCAANVSINNTPGQCTGTTTLTQPTVSDNCPNNYTLSNAIKCDGSNDYVESSPLSLGSSDFTVEFMVKPATLGGYPVLFAQDQAGTGAPAFRVEATNGSNVLLFVMSDASYSVAFYSTTALSVGTWTHVAVVRSGSTYTIYMNGVASGTSTIGGSINQSANTFNLRIGSRRNSSGTVQDPFNGTFDEFRVWNVARTPGQLLTNMTVELAGSESGLIRYYKFNQGTAGGSNAGLTTVTATTGANATLFNFALTGVASNWVQGIPTTASFTVTNDAPTTYPKGNTTVVWTTTDAAGNTATCGQTVTVVDNEAPTISCPVDQGVNANLNTCTGTFTIADPVNDNCSGATYGYIQSGATTGTASGFPDGSGSGPISFNIGTTTVTLVGTDAANNTASCSFTLTVYDIQPPSITCAGNVSINNTPGQCTGTTTLTQPTVSDNCSVANNALHFDGSNDGVATASYSGTSIFTGDLTIEAWFRSSANLNGQCLLSRAHNREFDLTFWGNQLNYYHGNGSTYVNNVAFNYVFSPNIWYHIAVVRNISTNQISLYVNGVFEQTIVAQVVAISPTTIPLYIGRRPGGNYFPGAVDDLRIWNVQRTALEISGNYNSELNTYPSSLIAYYKFNHGVPGGSNAGVTTLTDFATTPRNGTLSSFALTGATSNWIAGPLGGLSWVSNAPGTYPIGTTTVTWTATDGVGLTATCSQTVTVTDSEAPTVTCPATTTTINTNAGASCEITIPNYAALLSPTDNCTASGSIVEAQTIPAGAYNVSGDGATVVVNYTATDGATVPNTTTCTVTITVNDNDAPTFTCPTPTLVLNTTGNGSCEVSIPDLVAMVSDAADNCGLAVVPVTQSIPAGAYSGVSDGNTIPVVVMVADAATPANTTTCTITFTVNDDDAPVVTCPAATTVINTNAGSSCEITIPNYVAMLSPTDNCTASGNIVEAQTILAGGYTTGVYHGATITVQYTATDSATPANTTTCTVEITVNDDDAPTLANPGDQVLNTILNTCAANYTIIDPLTDNCVATWSYTLSGATFGASSGIADGSNSNVISFNKGITNVTLNGIDEASNLAMTVWFTVTVLDTQAPTLTCPSNQVFNTAPNSCNATFTLVDPIYDNCPGVTWGFGLSGATTSTNSGIADGANINNVSFNPGVTTVTYSGVDASGNLATTCSFTVSVTDNQLPVFTCPTPALTLNTTGNNNCEVVIPNLVPLVIPSDNCGLAVPAVTQSIAAGVYTGVSHGSTIPVSLTVTDASGNTAGCTVTFTVNDNDAPGLSCPSNIVQASNPLTCEASVPFTLPTPTDNCTGVSLVSTHLPGSSFVVGTTTVVLTATDGAGNSTSCSFTVTVNDATPPLAVCPSNISQPASPGQCFAPVTFTIPPASDNCTGNPSEFSNIPSGSNFAVGTTTVQITASDAANNTGTCSFTVTVTDNQTPVAQCPASITQTVGTGVCNTAVSFTLPPASDNCSAVSVANPASGSSFGLGTSTVTVTATDASNNSSSCSFTVTINGTAPPVANCPANIIQGVDAGQCFATVNFTLPAPSDDCGATSTANPASGSAFAIGTTTVTVTATDAVGSIGTCSFTVTVPNPVVPAIYGTPTGCSIVTLMASGGTGYQWSGGNTPNQALNSFTTSGTYTVTVTNGNGCANTASVVVTVIPTTFNVTTVSTCNSYFWPITGLTYTATGLYHHLVGCHTETLDLTIANGGNTTNTTYMFACVSYTWPVNGQTYTETGIYTHTVGCTTEILDLTINEGNETIGYVSGITSSICEGETISTTANGGTNYQWSGPNGYTATGAILNRPNATTDMTGLYTVTISAGNGCSETIITTLITVNTNPVAGITGVNNLCIGNTIMLTATGGNFYQWSGPGGYTNSGAVLTRVNATAPMSGVYTVTVTNANGCIGTASMNVMVNAAPVITITGATAVCTGSIINLTATGGVSYQWSGPGGFTATGAYMTRTAAAGTGGTYSVTVTDANGCTGIKAVTVSVTTSTVSANITGTLTYCAGTTITLTASGGVSYQWSGPAGIVQRAMYCQFPTQHLPCREYM
ncbi:MAG: HYR domain-containing protein [Sphingobacteriales bacterium]|nr:MAG: HYR domain-containing protein [Sphingobacteriales bacterium]